MYLTNILRLLAAATVAALALTACGGGGGSAAPAAADNGSVYIGMTDADGDFLRYEVDVVSIRLRRADGTEVDTLPNTTRLDFAQYVDLTEFFTAAQVPAGRYVRGLITLDYSQADVWVDVGGAATQAVVRDPDGNPLGTYTLEVDLDGDRPLVVRPGLPSLLTVDFDLDASHQVDVSQSPPVVTAAPFLSADVDPVTEKQIRARGPLIAVSEADSSYSIHVRPFLRLDGEFGELTVHTTAMTAFEVNGIAYTGGAGLAALAALPEGAATVAFGTLDVANRRFTASIVQAGDSVPGANFDVVVGNVTRRDGNTLVVRGATLMPRDGQVRFLDDVRVVLGDGTRVTRRGDPDAELDIGALSVGQRVEIFGEIMDESATPSPIIDADPGRARLLVTHLAGTVNSVIAGQVRMNLSSIDGRRIDIFDFAGTGTTPALDADPADYEIATGALDLANLEAGEPARVLGQVRPFGLAPDDFDAATVIDRADGPALLGIGWGIGGTPAPFSSIDNASLVLDLGNPEVGLRHHLLTGGVLVDLDDLPASPTIVPAASGPTRYAIAEGFRVQVFADFPAYTARLTELLDGSRKAFAVHAEGRYDRNANVFNARIIAVNISGPAQ